MNELKKLRKEQEKLSNLVWKGKKRPDKFFDVTFDESVVIPFGLAAYMFYQFYDIANITNYDDYEIKETTLSKAAKKVQKVTGIVLGGASALLVGALEAPFALPLLGLCGIQTGVNKILNKRLEKAKIRKKEIDKQIKMLESEKALEM